MINYGKFKFIFSYAVLNVVKYKVALSFPTN